MLTVLKGQYQQMNREQLYDVPVPSAEDMGMGARWKGIQHGELASNIVASLKARDFVVKEETYAVSPTGNTLVGGIRVGRSTTDVITNLPDDEDFLPGIDLCMGFTHSNDGTKALKLSWGAEVMICSNGIITGSQFFNRRHTINLDLTMYMYGVVCAFTEKIVNVKADIDYIKERELNYDNAMMALGRRNILPWNMIGKLDKDCQEVPARFQHSPNSWDWYNKANVRIKELAAPKQLNALERTYGVAREYCQAI